MTLEQLQDWILSDDGMLSELTLLSRFAAARSIDATSLTVADEIVEFKPNWRKLLLAASILSPSKASRLIEFALSVAHAGLLFSDSRSVEDASGILLTQLSNHRALGLATSREILAFGLEARTGISERIAMARRELSQTVFLQGGDSITANNFQRQFWDDLTRSAWVSASAPTAAGKTYLVLQWLVNEFLAKKVGLAVFLAPTRALVGEIERELLDLSVSHGASELRVASLPIAELGDRSKPTILVFTQERLHVFLNSVKPLPKIDVLIVDEAHKIADGLRGVILQDAIERVAGSNGEGRVVMLGPLTENPELLISDAPKGVHTSVTPSETPTVSQNLILAEQKPRDPTGWTLSLQQGEARVSIGDLALHARPDAQRKRLSYVALAMGRHHTGTLVYANGADEAEKLAWQLYDGLGEEADLIHSDQELKDLADFARDTVHSEFQLVDLLARGVAFHYGNMPSLLRSEIERLFRKGSIKFLVCTSTLVEGVNLACRTIVMRGPRKGNKQPMRPHDFWNLAGRAGRWGQDFHGNIVCVDVNQPHLWPEGVPKKSRFPVVRETDAVLKRPDAILPYLIARSGLDTNAIVPELEQVAAYLLAWQSRAGSFLQTPTARRLDPSYAQQIEAALSKLLDSVDVPAEIISRHPGVSAAALQSLLNYFRSRKKPVEELIPSVPESDDAYNQFIAIFHRINQYLYPAFIPAGAISVFSLVTVEWMRGLPLGQIISNRIAYLTRRERSFSTASAIRDTMRDVEDIARFRAPKYLAAYIDVLRYHLNKLGREALLPESLTFDLYLEFGVSTKTLLSLIGLGLSRTSAVSVNEFLASDSLSEEDVFDRLKERRWQAYNLPNIVKREIGEVVDRRAKISATPNVA
jgi:superfamily II DNA/RNA helicase